MTSVAIVILNWNGWKDTVECLKSINDLNTKNYKLQIIVVDNGSTDESLKELSKIKNKNLEIIETGKNLGFAGGNNVGIKKALEDKYDYIMVLNNDTILEPNMLVNLVSKMEEHPEIGASSPKMYFAKGFEFHKDKYKASELGNVIWYAGGDIDWNNVYGSNHGVDEVDKGQFDNDQETTFASGACLFLKAESLKKAGVFDEKYFLYLEDTDLCMRIRRAGFKIYLIPSSVLWHKVSQSSGIGSNLNDYFITRNRLLFASQYANLRANIALFRESIRFLYNGRLWQKRGVIDFYTHKFGKGSWEKQ